MTADDTEDLDTFRMRARSWIHDNLKPAAAGASAGVLRNNGTDEEELAQVAHERELQGMLFDAGLAGICFPVAYGGQGLTPAHQHALCDESSSASSSRSGSRPRRSRRARRSSSNSGPRSRSSGTSRPS